MLDFETDMRPGPGIAVLSKDELQLALNAVGGAEAPSRCPTEGSLKPAAGTNSARSEGHREAVGSLSNSGASIRNDLVEAWAATVPRG